MACAWGGFAGYGVAMIVSYFVGQKYYPINYPLRSIAYYVLIAAICYMSMMHIHDNYNLWISLGFNTLVVIFFLSIIIRNDLPLSGLPVIGKYFRK